GNCSCRSAFSVMTSLGGPGLVGNCANSHLGSRTGSVEAPRQAMQNFLKTTVLLAGMTALFIGVGYMIGGTSGMMIAFGVAVATNVFAYWNSDKMVLSMQGARPVDPRTAPDLYRMVEA